MTDIDISNNMCDICLSTRVSSKAEEDEHPVPLKIETVPKIPGAEGCVSLDANLRAYFISTRLLKSNQHDIFKLCSSKKNQTMLSSSHCKDKRNNKNSRDQDGIVGSGSGKTGQCRRLAYLCICERCVSIVNEAISLHVKVLRMKRKIDELGERLQEIKETAEKSEKKRKRNRKAAGEIPTCTNDNDSSEDQLKSVATANQMLGLSLACLGKAPFPSRARKESISPRKLRCRASKTTPGKIPNLEDGSQKIIVEEESLQWESQKFLNEDGNFHIKEESDGGESKGPMDADPSNDITRLDYFMGIGECEQSRKSSAPITFSTLIPESVKSMGQDEDEIQNEASDEDDLMEENLRLVNIPENDDDDADYEPDSDAEGSDFEDDMGDPDYDDAPLPRQKKPSVKRVKSIAEPTNTDGDYDDEDEELLEDNIRNTEDEEASFDTEQFPLTLSAVTNNEPISSVQFQCKDCHRIFSNRAVLRSHTKSLHGYEINYTCPNCPSLEFTHRSDYIRHRNQLHGHACEKCGRRFKRNEALKIHYKLVHKMKLTYPCDLCNKIFKKHMELIRHRAKDHTVSQKVLSKLPLREPANKEEEDWSKIPCGECDKRFLSGESLENHIIWHEFKRRKEGDATLPSRRKCYFCFKTYRLEQRNIVHCKMTHPEKLSEQLHLQFSCDECNNNEEACQVTFTNCELLRKHFETDHKDIVILTCEHCKWPFLDKDSFKKHQAVHSRRDPPEKILLKKVTKQSFDFKCWFCWETFPDQAKLERHLKNNRRHQKLKMEFFCDLERCQHYFQRPFPSVVELNAHLASSHGDMDIFHCDCCNWGFVSKDMLTIHKLNHVERIKQKFKCPECGHISEKLGALKNHYNLAHELGLKLHKCLHCPTAFRTLKAITAHITIQHPDVDSSSKFACEQCGKMLSSMSSLKSHYANAHNTTGNACDLCGKHFKSLASMVYHKRSFHDVGRKILCSVCGKAVIGRIGLERHMEAHKERKYQCHLCPLMMKTPERLKQHIERVHKRPNMKDSSKKLLCVHCGKGFSRKDSLEDHVRIQHTQDTKRVWICDTCGKRFQRQCYLNDHLKLNKKACMKRLEAAAASTGLSEQLSKELDLEFG